MSTLEFFSTTFEHSCRDSCRDSWQEKSRITSHSRLSWSPKSHPWNQSDPGLRKYISHINHNLSRISDPRACLPNSFNKILPKILNTAGPHRLIRNEFDLFHLSSLARSRPSFPSHFRRRAFLNIALPLSPTPRAHIHLTFKCQPAPRTHSLYIRVRAPVITERSISGSNSLSLPLSRGGSLLTILGGSSSSKKQKQRGASNNKLTRPNISGSVRPFSVRGPFKFDVYIQREREREARRKERGWKVAERGAQRAITRAARPCAIVHCRDEDQETGCIHSVRTRQRRISWYFVRRIRARTCWLWTARAHVADLAPGF